MTIKLNKCLICRKYPFVEYGGNDINHKSELKIFCPHLIFDGKNHAEVAGNWNIHNVSDEMLATENVLKKEWNTPEENKAWNNL